MITVKQIKTAWKAVLDATQQFGSVYTEDRTSGIEKPNPAYVLMWHDGGQQAHGPGAQMDRTTSLLTRIVVPQPPGPMGIVEMQTIMDDKVEILLEASRVNQQLDTGGGPLVETSIVDDYEIIYDEPNKRAIATFRFVAKRPEG